MFHSYFKYFLDSYAKFRIRHQKDLYTPPPPTKWSTGMRNGTVMGHTLKSQTASARRDRKYERARALRAQRII